MKKGFYLSQAAAAACLLTAIAAAAVIIALSVVYSQEKSKSQAACSTTTTEPGVPTTPGPPSTPSTPKEPWQRYRLPDTLRPVSYNVTLWPQLQPNGDQGHHTVLRGLDGAPTPSLRRTWLEVPTQYLVVQLSGPLVAGSSYQLYTQFVGELADDLAGFYRSEYTMDGERRVLAASQMQATAARKVFPCFDEPAMKAVFHITLIHPHGTVALSNSMNYEPLNVTMDGEKLLLTSFEPTQLMSTYVLALAVCDFTFRETRLADNTLIRVWARKTAIELGHGDYALEKTGPILAFYEDYYNSSYPLCKSDQIAIPDFEAGAMENWGLVMYSEPALLYNPAGSSNEDKEWVVKVISHELAHMWFGNLVTMRWWNDLWLNEGLANYISYLGSNYTEPEWGLALIQTWTHLDSSFQPDLMVLNEVISVMRMDALASSHPLSSKEDDIQTPFDIEQLFDSITYSKGAAVLRMLSDFITEEAFTTGLRAVKQAGVKLPHSVDAIMNRWILQMGFPVVTIDTRTGSVRQQHFLLGADPAVVTPSEFNYTWFVPIKWIKNGGAEQLFWLLEKEKTNPDLVLDSSGWLLANVDMKGFYRVNYDPAHWERLLAILTSRPQVGSRSQLVCCLCPVEASEHLSFQDIPLINRVQIIDDAFNLARAGMVNITLALRTTRFLEKEHEYMPWQAARDNLGYIFLMFGRSEVFGSIQAYLRKQVTPLFNYFSRITANWTRSPERHTDLYNQVNAITLACSAGVTGCKDLTTGWFREWMRNPDNNTISLNLKSTVYCNAIASGGAEEWDFAWSMFQNSSLASEAEKLLHSLSCTQRPWLLNRSVRLSSSRVLPARSCPHASVLQVPALLPGPRQDPQAGRPRHHHANQQQRRGPAPGVEFCPSRVGRHHSVLLQFKEEQAKELSVDLALERVRTNMKWVSLNKEQVVDWFSREVSSGSH
uniref:Aminopeptidase n=1 Tax=Tetraodon nigroviridis TaxID=99883 RepID=H3D2Y9_TETNG